jgi:hypothetical protein
MASIKTCILDRLDKCKNALSNIDYAPILESIANAEDALNASGGTKNMKLFYDLDNWLRYNQLYDNLQR